MPMLSAVQRRSLERALHSYTANVDKALPYLAERGIDKARALSEGLGVVVDPIPGHEHLRGRLCIPYLTAHGPVNMNFRCIQGHDCKDFGHQKYMMLSGYATNLYHVKSIDAAGEFICLAEGEIDTISANAAGLPTVGVSGAKKWEEWWTDIFMDFTRVYVFEDGDKAGSEFGSSVISMLPNDMTVIRVPMPNKEDVNSMWVKEGSQYLRDRIKA